MARTRRNFEIAFPPGGSRLAPITLDLDLPPSVVRAIRWRVPPGPAGLFGWALGSAGQPVIPWGPGEWIIADNEADRWELAGGVESGDWQVFGWNEGAYLHTLYLTFELDPPGSLTGGALLGPLTVTP